RDAILAVIDDQCGARTLTAADDLLARRPPRLAPPRDGPVMQGTDPVAGVVSAVLALDGGVLPIQGPPGTGKTYVAARAILALVRQGKRVAVAASSHEAIGNVLLGCIDALEAGDADIALEDVELARKVSDGPPELAPPYDRIAQTIANGDPVLSSADVVGGTAWLFARDGFAGAFDTLFVDEAGQMSLANLVAMARCARNIVLIGDPRQLPQVIQGAHPPPADRSALEWLLGDAATVPADRGIFLPVSRRMHPDICRFVSAQVYEGRLESHPDTARQRVDGAGALPPHGAHLVFVEHAGRAQEAPEEVAAIAATIGRLLGAQVTGRDGVRRPLRLSDIIVVAPYNAQVNALIEGLPPGAQVGTVDKFQGKEAAVCLVSMTSSSAEDAPRGLDFLFSLNRVNVAVSRAKALCLVFASPRLLEARCATVEDMRLVNTLCALAEHAPPLTWRGDWA
ncbi:MAG: DEAD/DEAH box helicase, partial [Rubrimonas sp.]